jgi:uncharacterized SAM-binding protein YcdF (DUF218 family)
MHQIGLSAVKFGDMLSLGPYPMTVGERELARDNAGEGSMGEHPPARPARRSWLRRVLAATVALGGLAILCFGLGFLWFAWLVPRQEVVLTAKADAIVALTGGASRVVDAVELLATGHGRRLLITGVNKTTHSGELARLAPDYERLFICCIDLDHAARNTIGNAVETRRWSMDRGFRSLVVVTSSYHMPRAMAELTHRLPNVQLIPFPVVTEKRAQPWWSSAANARLLLSEYVKFIVAMARIRFEPAIESAGLAPHAGTRS